MQVFWFVDEGFVFRSARFHVAFGENASDANGFGYMCNGPPGVKDPERAVILAGLRSSLPNFSGIQRS